MIRGTTPTLEFTFPFDVSTLSSCYVTFQQNGKTVIEKQLTDGKVDGKKLSFILSQEDTLKFKVDYIEMQIRCKTFKGEVIASNIMQTHAEKILKDGVV